MKELTEAEAEALAAKWPLPSFDNQEDEIETARDFIRSRERGLACCVLGLSSGTMRSYRRDWTIYRRERLEARRWTAWCRASNTHFDKKYGKFLSTNPDAQP